MKTDLQRAITTSVKSYYDFQKFRISHALRILTQTLYKLNLPPVLQPLAIDASKEEKDERKRVEKERQEKIDAFLLRLGINPQEEETDENGKKYKKSTDFFKLILDEYRKIKEQALATQWSTMSKKWAKDTATPPKNITEVMVFGNKVINAAIKDASVGIISESAEIDQLDGYEFALKAEERQYKAVSELVQTHPIWIEFLKGVKGCGPMMAGVIISQVDIVIANTPSKLFAYVGNDTVLVRDEDDNIVYDEDGKEVRSGRSKREEHLVKREYITKKGERKEKRSITYNPFMKAKMNGVLSGNFFKAKSYYAEVYHGYKTRIDNSPKHADKNGYHRKSMGTRYMIKAFLLDLWIAWRLIEGLEVRTPYYIEKLGLKPHKTSPYLRPVLEKYAPQMIVD
jgi:hypothetical protein